MLHRIFFFFNKKKTHSFSILTRIPLKSEVKVKVETFQNFQPTVYFLFSIQIYKNKLPKEHLLTGSPSSPGGPWRPGRPGGPCGPGTLETTDPSLPTEYSVAGPGEPGSPGGPGRPGSPFMP